MTRFISTFLLSTLFISISWGQKATTADSLEIMIQADRIFRLFADPDFSAFKNISTDKIYCIMCFDRPNFKDDPYMLDRKSFFDDHMKAIGESDIFRRASKKIDAILMADNDRWSDITVFFTVYQRDELAPGHEGGVLGFHFKREHGEFKFSGIETVP